MRSMRHIDFRLLIFQFSINRFWSTMCKLVGFPTNVDKTRRYADKVLFSGVFQDSSIFQYRGMVMDENGRNGRKWYLAQQIAYHVITHILSIAIFNNKSFKICTLESKL